MAALIKIIYYSYLSNIIGATIFGYWLMIDFNDIKIRVLGIMSMVWATGVGLISLWRLWIKAQRENFDLDQHKKGNNKPVEPIKIEKEKRSNSQQSKL